MDWWNISVFGIIPLASVALLLFVKRKMLWTAPLVSTAGATAFSVLTLPSLLENQEYRNLFFGISIPMQFAVAALLTLAAYAAAYIWKRGREKQKRFQAREREERSHEST